MLILASCAKPTKTPTITELTAELDKYFDSSMMHSLDPDRTAGELNIETSAIDAFTMNVPISTNMDEYGVFIAASGHEAELTSAVNAYIKRRQDSWMNEYLPEERPKIFEAQTKSNGRYIIYVMSSEDTRNNVLSKFDSLTI